MTRPRKPGQPHKGWKAAARRTEPVAGTITTPIGLVKQGGTYHGITATLQEDGTTVYAIHTTPALPPPTLPATPTAPPGLRGEARSAGITDDAGSAAADATRDS